MRKKFKGKFLDLKEKMIIVATYDPHKNFATQKEAWLDAVTSASEIARKNKWILLEIENYLIEKEE